MNKNIKFFLTVLSINIAGWWIFNLLNVNLEQLFYWQEIGRNPEMLRAQINIEPKLEKILAQEESKTELQLEIQAESAISVFVNPKGEEEIIFEKNSALIRPIASLTKLMTALVSQKIYESEQAFYISQRAIDQEGDKGNLKVGERLYLRDLLHSMLIESSNDAAWAIAEGEKTPTVSVFQSQNGNESESESESETESESSTESQKEEIAPLTENYLVFVESMNFEAQKLTMKDTYFVNPTGLNDLDNYSTAQDLVKLIRHIVENEPQIFSISRKQSYEVLNAYGNFHHFITENTNKLLYETSGIIGGKTGYTDEAGGCMILVLENEEGGYFINIILGTISAEERFIAMRKTIELCRANQFR